MAISPDTLYEEIRARDYKWCRILKGNTAITTLGDKKHGSTYTCEQLIADLKPFFKRFPDTYSILLKKKLTDRNSCIAKWDHIVANDYSNTAESVNSNNIDVATLTKEIETKLFAKMLEIKKQDEMIAKQKLLDEKVAEIQTVGGKLNILLEGVAMHFINKFQLHGMLQGTQTNFNMDTTTIYNDARPKGSFTELDYQNANQALENLIRVASPETILAVSEKFIQNPALIGQLRAFAGV